MSSNILSDAKEIQETNTPLEYFDPLTVNAANDNVESNAQAIVNHTHKGINHLVDLKIVIEGTECGSFKNFRLSQCIKGHHTFELFLHHNALGEHETYQMVQTQELLGKRILVRFNLKNSKEKPERDFVGIITEVSFEQIHGSCGGIILSGYSPTILLDKAPHIQSFGGMESISLHTIVNQVLEENYKQRGKFKYLIKSRNQVNLSYSCQYNETAYNYLARMAEAYGEQFFYDGERLYFGDIPTVERPIILVYGRDVGQVKINMAVQHVNRKLYGYNSLDNERLSATGSSKLSVKGTLAKTAYEKSQQVFTTPSLQLAPIKAYTNQDITQAQKGLIGSTGMDVFFISGTTTVPFLYPGCIVELNMLHAQSKEEHYFTKLMITNIKHEVDVLGRYEGYFEAVDADTGFIPRIKYQNPPVEQQLATVINNSDPNNTGRVQVRFDWQDVDASSAFIRIMTPDAGCSSIVDKNRGFMAIPEVGDQVVVGFISQHPDRPFVMGSLFHGDIGAGGGENNKIKSWITKSGHCIEFNDNEGIKILDKNNNMFLLDGEGNIVMNSSKSICLKSGKSSLILTEEGKITMQGVELIQNGQTSSHVATDKLITQCGEAIMILNGEGNQATITSKYTTVNGTSVASINGGLEAKITADGTASIEGAIVKLN